MDHAVALVEAYLQINGYFTVAEFPVIESMGQHRFKTATDLDILALRFPGAGRIVASKHSERYRFETDPALAVDNSGTDMIIGEVKEGRAGLNSNTTNPNVLHTVLARFGCCPIEHIDDTVSRLIRHGQARTQHGHRIRLMAFGARTDGQHAFTTLSTGHITRYIEDYLDEHWHILRNAQFKHPALGMFAVIKKARDAIAPRSP